MHSISTAAALVLLAFVCCSCSPQAKTAGHLKEANSNFSAGRYDKAEIEYLNVLQLDPRNPQAIGGLGSIYFDQGRTSRVASFLLKAKELQPDNLDVRFKLGIIFLAAGNTKAALDEANFILDRKPQDEQAPLLLAEASNKPELIDAAKRRLLSLAPPAPDSVPVLVALGTLEMFQRNFKEAEAPLRRALALNPKSASTQAAIGAWHLTQKDLPQAELAFKQASALASPYSPRRLIYAKFKVQGGDLDAARRALGDITAKTPDFLPAWILLADLTAGEKKYPESAAMIAKVLALDPANPEALLLSARMKRAQGENSQAVTELEKMLKYYPKSPQANYQLAAAYAVMGETAKAIIALNQTLILAPGFGDAIILLAELNLRNGDFNAAITSLVPLLKQRPENVQAALILAAAYRSQGNLDGAISTYRKIEEISPRNAQAAYGRGVILLQQTKRADARKAFSQALDYAPDFFLALEQLINLDLGEKNYPGAHQKVESQLARDPKQAGPYLLKAKIAFAQQDMPQVEIALRKAIELQPDSPVAYLMLARIYSTSEQLDKALTNFKSVTAKSPKNLEALMMTAILFDKKGDFPAARESYEKLLAINPQFMPALNNLAYLFAERFNELEKAQDLAQKAANLLPHEPHVADTLGWILYKKRQYPRALSLLTESASKLADSAEVQFHLGMTHYMLGAEEPARIALMRAIQIDPALAEKETLEKSLAVIAVDPKVSNAAAVAKLEKILSDRPEDVIALTRLAALYARSGAASKAITTYQTAIRLSPTNVAALLELARVQAAEGDNAKAFETAKTARKVDADNVEVAQLLGQLAFKNNDYQWSYALLQEAVRKTPDDSALLFEFAQAAYATGRISDATTALKQALQPNRTFAGANQAQLLLELSEQAEKPTLGSSAARADEALKTNANYVPALMIKAIVAAQTGQSDDAQQIYAKILSLYPDFTPALKNLAKLYADTRKNDAKAVELALKARAAFPEDPEIAKSAGILLFLRADYTRAASFLQTSSMKRSEDATTWFYLGMSQYQLKKTSESKQSLQRALNLKLPAELAAEAQKTLTSLK